jgi:small subunit ribosomal protein S17
MTDEEVTEAGDEAAPVAAEAPVPEVVVPEVVVPEVVVPEVVEEGAVNRPNRRKVREGIAVSTKMDKTVIVKVVDRVAHPRYRKTLQRTNRLYAHDETNDVKVGDRVRIQETRPMSRTKRWRVVDVLERAR